MNRKDKSNNKKYSPDLLADMISSLSRLIKRGNYKHLKTGVVYIVERIVLREFDLEPMIVYKTTSGPEISFCRTVDEFLEKFRKEI